MMGIVPPTIFPLLHGFLGKKVSFFISIKCIYWLFTGVVENFIDCPNAL